MNYALPVYAVVLGLVLVSWRFWARDRWSGLSQHYIEAVKDDD